MIITAQKWAEKKAALQPPSATPRSDAARYCRKSTRSISIVLPPTLF